MVDQMWLVLSGPERESPEFRLDCVIREATIMKPIAGQGYEVHAEIEDEDGRKGTIVLTFGSDMYRKTISGRPYMRPEWLTPGGELK